MNRVPLAGRTLVNADSLLVQGLRYRSVLKGSVGHLFPGGKSHFEMNGGVIRIFPLKYSIISPRSFLNSLADTLQ